MFSLLNLLSINWKQLYFLFFFCLFAHGCSEEGEEKEGESEETGITETGQGTTSTTGKTVSVSESLRLYIFGNSLVVHEVTPEPTEEKKVPHWLGLMTSHAGQSLTVDGRYGFMRDYSDFSEIGPQWGFSGVASSWTDESVAFGDIDFNRIIYTPTNFIQWQGAAEAYYDDPNTSPLTTTLSTFDQTVEAHPGISFYIYAGWSDMAEYGSFPSGVNLASYYQDAQGSYHDWFLDYHDRLIRSRPELTIKIIPTYFILAKLLSTTPLSGMDISDVYEDDAPHGEPTLYFLASLITYSALYQTQAPSDLTIPTTVHHLVREHYTSIISKIMTELEAFNHDDGSSRVF